MMRLKKPANNPFSAHNHLSRVCLMIIQEINFNDDVLNRKLLLTLKVYIYQIMPRNKFTTQKTVLVTTGATVTFSALLSIILNHQFIKSLQDQGYKKLRLQYGKGDQAVKLYTDLITKGLGLEIEIIDDADSDNKIHRSLCHGGFMIEGFPFSNNISEEIITSDLVISHSGTGSILDSLRLRKKLIVVVNDKLMDNHQLEIAEEFEKGGYLLKADRPDTNLLIGLLKDIQKRQLTELPLPVKDILKNIIESL